MNLVKKGINYYKNIPVEKKSIIWYAICNIFQKGVAFFTTPIITRFLTTGEYGTYSVFLSWRELLTIFFTLNLYCGVFTKLLVDNIDDQDKCTSSMQGLGCVSTILFSGIYFAFMGPINKLLDLTTPIMIMLIVYFFFYPAFSLWCTKQRVNNKYISMVIVTMVVSFLTPVVSILMLLLTNYREVGVIFGSTIVYAVFGMFFFIYNITRSKGVFDKKYWVFALKYNIPLIPHYLSIMVLGQSDRIMIKYLEDESKVGLYSLAYQISMVMNIVFNSINSSFVPMSYTLMKENKLEKLRKESNKIIIFGMLMTYVAVLFAPEFVLFMGGSKYAESIYVIPPVCISTFITFYYGFFSGIEFYYSKTSSIMTASTLAALTNIGLNWLLIPKFGYIAAGYTTLASYVFLLVFHYVFSRKIAIEHHGEAIYKSKPVIALTTFSIAMSAVLVGVYKIGYWRYGIIAIALIVAIIKRKTIIQIIRKNK